MQIELKAIQAEVGITFIYVTHDQEEALTMSNRVAVFNWRSRRAGRHAGRHLRASGHDVRGRLRGNQEPADRAGGPCRHRRGRCLHRSSREDPVGGSECTGRRTTRHRSWGPVREVVYVGPDTRYIVELDSGGELVVTQQNLETSSMEALTAHGRPVRLVWKRRHVLSLAPARSRWGKEGGTTE